jgi:hypothetical protein
MQQLMITVGIFSASSVNSVLFLYASGDMQWRLALGAQLVPVILFLLVLAQLPMSPRWLIMSGRVEEGVEVICRLRGLAADSPQVQAEVSEIKQELVQDAGKDAPRGLLDKYTELLSPALRPRLLLVTVLQFFQQFTGINLVLFYAAVLFEAAGAPHQEAATVLVVANAAVLVLATLPGLWLLDRPNAGRRKLLIFGGAAMALCHTGASLCAGAAQREKDASGAFTPSGKAFAYAAISFLFCFTAAFSESWGPAVWVVQNEVWPFRSRAAGTAAGTTVNWISNAAIGKFAPLLLALAGSSTYLIFAVFCVIMALYTFLALPETAGLSIESITELWTKEGRLRDSPGGRLARAVSLKAAAEEEAEVRGLADEGREDTA